jgi:DNA-directed RNA polymerase subunit E"
MAKRKVCKTCKLFVEGQSCPVCKNSKLTENWKGRIYITSPEESMIAEKVNVKIKGEYAIKVH